MPVELNHHIVAARDSEAAATSLAELLGRPDPEPFGPFWIVELDNGASLDFVDTTEEVTGQHYAFLVGEVEFDEIFDRILERGLSYWADPHKDRPTEINTRDGGRAIYWDSPDGHLLEILTRPYGSGG
jgi:hypothetical protein